MISGKKLISSNEEYCNKPEYIIAEFSFAAASKLLAGVVYRPPKIGYLNEFEIDCTLC